MTTFLLVAVTAIISGAAALWLARRLGQAAPPVTLATDLAPEADPLLALVLRANQALGVWVSGRSTEPPVRAVDARLGTAVEEMILARLPRLAEQSASGMELLERGALVHLSVDGRVALALLPAGLPQSRIDSLRRDLNELLARLRREPLLASVNRMQGRPDETVESIAMRLAHQVERLLDAEVGVALARPQGVQVLGVSARSDPRLLLSLATPGSPLDLVGRGIVTGPLVSDDPLGKSGNERRRARPRAVVLPIPSRDLTVGAIVVATAGGALPAGSITGELLQALEAAGAAAGPGPGSPGTARDLAERSADGTAESSRARPRNEPCLSRGRGVDLRRPRPIQALE